IRSTCCFIGRLFSFIQLEFGRRTRSTAATLEWLRRSHGKGVRRPSAAYCCELLSGLRQIRREQLGVQVLKRYTPRHSQHIPACLSHVHRESIEQWLNALITFLITGLALHCTGPDNSDGLKGFIVQVELPGSVKY